jgi:hypothetical protein
MPNDRAAHREKASGLRSVATLQTLANGAKPRERHQLANRFARMENERARLERELGAWENCAHAAAVKLAKVNQEIAAIRARLFDVPGKRAALRRGRGQRPAPAETQVAGSTALRGRAISLEY